MSPLRTAVVAGLTAVGSAAGVLAAAPAGAATGHYVMNNCYGPGATHHALLMNGPYFAGWDFVPCGQGRSGVTALESPYARVALCNMAWTGCVIYGQGYVMNINYDHEAYTV